MRTVQRRCHWLAGDNLGGLGIFNVHHNFDAPKGIDDPQPANFQRPGADGIEVVEQIGRSQQATRNRTVSDSFAYLLQKSRSHTSLNPQSRIFNLQLHRALVSQQGVVKAADALSEAVERLELLVCFQRRVSGTVG